VCACVCVRACERARLSVCKLLSALARNATKCACKRTHVSRHW